MHICIVIWMHTSSSDNISPGKGWRYEAISFCCSYRRWLQYGSSVLRERVRSFPKFRVTGILRQEWCVCEHYSRRRRISSSHDVLKCWSRLCLVWIWYMFIALYGVGCSIDYLLLRLVRAPASAPASLSRPITQRRPSGLTWYFND